MSILLDVVQKIVLHSAYELTVAAATQVYNKCRIMAPDNCEVLEVTETKSNVMDIEEPEPPGGICPLKVEESRCRILQLDMAHKNSGGMPDLNGVPLKLGVKELDTRCVLSQTDIDYKHSGPICPPKTSCMRVARNSYFS